jgi:hypothetical protein
VSVLRALLPTLELSSSVPALLPHSGAPQLREAAAAAATRDRFIAPCFFKRRASPLSQLIQRPRQGRATVVLLEENLTTALPELRGAAVHTAQALLEGNPTRPPPKPSPPPRSPSPPWRCHPRDPWSHQSCRAPHSPALCHHPLLRCVALIAVALLPALAILNPGDGAGPNDS